MNKFIYSIFVCTIYSLSIVAASADNSHSHAGGKKGSKLSKSTAGAVLQEQYKDSDSVKKTVATEVVDSSQDSELLSIFKILKLQESGESEIANKCIFIFLDPL